jgi:hypothetical protein
VSRRLAAPLLALALVPLSACSGGGDDAPGSAAPAASAAPVAVVRAAAQTSQGVGSSRFALDSATSVQGQQVSITGTGAFDYAGHTGSLTITLPAGKVEERVVGGKAYLGLSQQPGTFYAVDLATLQGTSFGASTDPTSSFASLAAVSDDVQTVGEEQVRGSGTTHYRGTIDVKKALAGTGVAKQQAEATLGRTGLATVPFDAWIDDEGRLRKYLLTLDLPASAATQGQKVTSSTTVELYDFGTPVTVTAPAAASVKDGAPLLAALKGTAGG